MIEPAITFVKKPEHKCDFDYTINLHYKYNKRMRGPKFRPFPFSSEEWCLELVINLNVVEVYAVRLNDKIGHFELTVSISVRGRPLTFNKEFYKDANDFRGTCCLLASYPHKDFFLRPKQDSFSSGDITLQVELLFSSYDISPYIPEHDLKVGSTLGRDLDLMRKNSPSSDITFCLVDGELKAHKPLLLSRCPHFISMFEPDTKRVVIDSTNVQVFEAFLIFLYTDQIKSEDWNIVLPLYNLAQKYQVPSLQKACSEVLGRNVDIDNFCAILIISHVHDDLSLKRSIMRYVWDVFNKVAMTDEWFSIVKQFPGLASEVLNTFTRVTKK